MIESYTQYINSYMTPAGLEGRRSPGEHHFVSSYLVPRLHKITGRIPDYINPDGTKEINGDVVYYRGTKHHFGIEVKLGTIRLTKNEFNTWIISNNRNKQPQIFLGIGTKGIALCPWDHFKDTYIRSVKAKNPNWNGTLNKSGYGPMKSVNTILNDLDQKYVFRLGSSISKATSQEDIFMEALRDNTRHLIQNVRF